MMNNRDSIIRMWFRMWLDQKDLGIDNIFDDNVVYTECWGPRYSDKKTIKIWFDEWNTRGKVIKWDNLQIFHHENPVSYTHLTLPTIAAECRSRWSPYH